MLTRARVCGIGVSASLKEFHFAIDRTYGVQEARIRNANTHAQCSCRLHVVQAKSGACRYAAVCGCAGGTSVGCRAHPAVMLAKSECDVAFTGLKPGLSLVTRW